MPIYDLKMCVLTGGGGQRDCSVAQGQLPREDPQQVCDDLATPRSEAQVEAQPHCLPPPCRPQSDVRDHESHVVIGYKWGG